jgi:hypothetical protein
MPGGRVDVRRVAAQEDLAHAVVRGLPLVAVEPRHPARVVHPEVAAQRLAGDEAHVLQLDRRGVGQLPVAVPGEDAVPAVPERRDERKPFAYGTGHQHVLGRVGQPHVGEHDRLHHRLSGKRQPHGVAHRAVEAVGADHIERTPHAALPVGPAHVHVDPGGVLTQPRHLDPGHDGGAQRLGAPVQDALGLVLRGGQQAGKASRQAGQVDLDVAEQHLRRRRLAGGDQLVGDTAGIEHLKSPGVHDERARPRNLVPAPL